MQQSDIVVFTNYQAHPGGGRENGLEVRTVMGAWEWVERHI